jgi:uncharacterized protein (DUF2336 family)
MYSIAGSFGDGVELCTPENAPLRIMTAMLAFPSLVTELEHAIAHGSARRRAEMLLQITDLFVDGSVRFSEEEIELFDEIITRLAAKIEVSVRSLLAHRLAPVANAPIKISRVLAGDDEIRVAYPILVHSEKLDDGTLVQSARTKGQAHLLAISQRKSLSETITDVLVERGDREVVLCTAKNKGAKFSLRGFSTLVRRSDGDDQLAMSVGVRPDIPHELFLTLLSRASEIVRSKLMLEKPQAKQEIQDAIATVTDEMRDMAIAESASHLAVQAQVRSLYESGQLNDGTIRAFAEGEKFEETTSALAQICDVPVAVVEQAMIQRHSETLLVLAKAANLSWATTKTLLSFRARRERVPTMEIAQYLASFERLKRDTAQQIIQFYRIR